MNMHMKARHPDTKKDEVLIGYFDKNNVSQMKYSTTRISENRIYSNGYPISTPGIHPVFVSREEFERFVYVK